MDRREMVRTAAHRSHFPSLHEYVELRRGSMSVRRQMADTYLLNLVR
jgi:hypothetical protein